MAWTLLVTKCIATRSKDATNGAPGLTTSSKKLLVTKSHGRSDSVAHAVVLSVSAPRPCRASRRGPVGTWSCQTRDRDRGALGASCYERSKDAPVTRFATSNKCIATSNKCLTSSNKKLLGAPSSVLAPTPPRAREKVLIDSFASSYNSN